MQTWTLGPGGAYTATWDGTTLKVTVTAGGALVASVSGQQVATLAQAQAAAAGVVAGFTGVPGPLSLQATTGSSGFALQNGTPTILSWTAPADGQPHRVVLVTENIVTVAETGGQCSVNFTPPSGAAQSAVVYGGALGVGYRGPNNTGFTVAPGTTVTFTQSTALTAGAATVFAELWGS